MSNLTDGENWLKLHTKLLENPMWATDINGSHILVTLLMLARRRNKNGMVEIGRKRLSLLTGINESTVYITLKRLQSQQMIEIVPNKRYTVIHICNWSQYQVRGNSKKSDEVTTNQQQSNNKVTTNQQQPNTKVRVRDRVRVRNNTTVLEKKDDEISKLYYEVIKKLNLPTRNHANVKKKITELTNDKDRQAVVNYLTFMRDFYLKINIDYKPEVAEALDIYAKRKSIENWVKREKDKKPKGVKIS